MMFYSCSSQAQLRDRTFPIQMHADEGSEMMFVSWQGELGEHKGNSLASRLLFTALEEKSYYIDENGVLPKCLVIINLCYS